MQYVKYNFKCQCVGALKNFLNGGASMFDSGVLTDGNMVYSFRAKFHLFSSYKRTIYNNKPVYNMFLMVCYTIVHIWNWIPQSFSSFWVIVNIVIWKAVGRSPKVYFYQENAYAYHDLWYIFLQISAPSVQQKMRCGWNMCVDAINRWTDP